MQRSPAGSGHLYRSSKKIQLDFISNELQPFRTTLDMFFRSLFFFNRNCSYGYSVDLSITAKSIRSRPRASTTAIINRTTLRIPGAPVSISWRLKFFTKAVYL
jgi:hypothetical protein